MGIRDGLVFRVAKRWIAGKTIDEALDVAAEANRKRIGTILNYLGEDVTVESVARRHFEEYLLLQRTISERALDGSVSVKLTQFGLAANERFAAEKTEELAQEAERLGQFFWLDMEGSRFTQKALDIYSDLLTRHKNVGIALQAYLKRSERDAAELLPKGAVFRLVKGAYREPVAAAYASGEEIRANFVVLMKMLFERGAKFAIGTHDSALVNQAVKLASSSAAKFEFQMLKGIRDDLKGELVKSGFRVVEYLPYGEAWYAYSMRRIREHPSNIWLLFRSVV